MKISNLRWWIAVLLMGAAVLNYLDRTALGVASAHIKDEFHLSASQYALIVNGFLVAYTLSYGFGGIIVDRLGTRRSVILTLAWWSAANMAHGVARSLGHLIGFRFLLGLGEAMYYPAAMRGIAEWFQPRDRSKPVGMLLGGSSLGGLVAPVLVGAMMAQPAIGWRGAFVVTGALGFLLLPAWLLLFRKPEEHPALTAAEHGYLTGEGRPPAPARKASVGEVLALPQAWILIVARFLTDASWFLIVFWMMLYFQKARGFSDVMVAKYGWIPFGTADLGALFGGWFSAVLIRRGMGTAQARSVCMFSFALLMVLTLAGYLVPADTPFLALTLFSIATFGHMAWGTNQLTLHSDLFPEERVATIMGITGAAGSLGGVVAGQTVGALVDHLGGSFLPVFLITAALHPIAGTLVLLRVPRLGGKSDCSRPPR